MLETLPLDIPWADPPDRIRQLIDTASRREASFLARRASRPVVGFHQSNFAMTYFALEQILANRWAAPEDAMLEWGCGLGVVSCIWASLGGEACGIEFDSELAGEAQQLAVETGCGRVRIAAGNFMPDDAWSRLDSIDEIANLARGGPCGYDLLGRGPAEFRIVFVYPWPGERRFMDDVFDYVAECGSLLMSFHGGDELRLQRKI